MDLCSVLFFFRVVSVCLQLFLSVSAGLCLFLFVVVCVCFRLFLADFSWFFMFSSVFCFLDDEGAGAERSNKAQTLKKKNNAYCNTRETGGDCRTDRCFPS